MRRVPRAVGRPAVDLPGPFPLDRPAWTNPPGQREIAVQRPQRASGWPRLTRAAGRGSYSCGRHFHRSSSTYPRLCSPATSGSVVWECFYTCGLSPMRGCTRAGQE